MASYNDLSVILKLLDHYKDILRKININHIEGKIMYLIYLGEFIVTYFYAEKGENAYFTGAKWIENLYYKSIVLLRNALIHKSSNAEILVAINDINKLTDSKNEVEDINILLGCVNKEYLNDVANFFSSSSALDSLAGF